MTSPPGLVNNHGNGSPPELEKAPAVQPMQKAPPPPSVAEVAAPSDVAMAPMGPPAAQLAPNWGQVGGCCHCGGFGGATKAGAAGLLERSAKRADRAEAEVRKLRAELHALKTEKAATEARLISAECAMANGPEDAAAIARARAMEAEARAVRAEEETLKLHCELQALRAAVLIEQTEGGTTTSAPPPEDDPAESRSSFADCMTCIGQSLWSVVTCPMRCPSRCQRGKVCRLAPDPETAATPTRVTPVKGSGLV